MGRFRPLESPPDIQAAPSFMIVLPGISKPLRGPILDCAAGRIPPSIAIMRLLMKARHAGETEHALEQALREGDGMDDASVSRLREALAVVRENADAWATIKGVL